MVTAGPVKCSYSVDNNSHQTMTRELMLSLMNRAANGNELLALIDSFAEEIQQAD